MLLLFVALSCGSIFAFIQGLSTCPGPSVRSLVAPLIVAVPAPLLVTVLFLVGSWLPLLAWRRPYCIAMANHYNTTQSSAPPYRVSAMLLPCGSQDSCLRSPFDPTLETQATGKTLVYTPAAVCSLSPYPLPVWRYRSTPLQHMNRHAPPSSRAT